MCGIAGFATGARASNQAEAEAILAAMSNCIAHRGPDSEGYWVDTRYGICFGHRRLAIVDLSAAGAQPMRSSSGRFVLTYNGEIYNHGELRSRLHANWRGTSDTETLLAGFEAWGVEKTLAATAGMFAFALWDSHERKLILARDRFGEKPLYYGWAGNGDFRTFLFASDLAAIRAHPDFVATVNRSALSSYMRLSNVPAGMSIYDGISKLPPGCILTLNVSKPEPDLSVYWSATRAAVQSHMRPFSADDRAATDELERLLTASVSQQMMADVPVGAFLSGGIDSSTIVALMQQCSSRPVRTFTIGFAESQHNEADHARAVAAHLRTNHTSLFVTPNDALQLIPELGAIYSEPFADSSQIPTYLLSHLTRQHVTVALSGDCGDELFFGYNRYLSAQKTRSIRATVPLSPRRAMARTLLAFPSSTWDSLGRWFGSGRSAASSWSRASEKVQKFARLIECRSEDELYLALVSHWNQPNEIVIGGLERTPPCPSALREISDFDPIEKMAMVDVVSYMTDDILAKVDRAAMATSLETRVPMLDHRVAEFAWTLPVGFKLRSGQAKWILRQVLARHVPLELVDRPKAGFAVPLDSWLRGPLREWAESLLDERRLRADGYLHAVPIRKRWAEHLSGRRNWYAPLWNVLMFQAWLDHNHGH